MRSASCLLLAAAVLAACPPPVDIGDGGNEIVVGPNGGFFPRMGAVIEIPRGAVKEETHIFVTVVDEGIPDVPGRTRISFGYRYSPSGLKFESPVKVYIPVIDDRVPRAVDPGTFDMRRNGSGEAFTQLAGAQTHTDLPGLEGITVVEAQSDRLALFWDTSPSQANVARLEIDPPEATLQVGGTQQFTARVVDPTGGTIDAEVTWAVAPGRVATIDATGLLTAVDPGTATVSARAGMQLATATVFVQGTATGPSTFVHSNPFPTGNDLWSGALAPGGLGTVFCGANSTVLAEANGQWTRLFSSPGVILKGVGGTTADNAAAVGVSGQNGVLVEFKGTAAPPAVRVFNTVEPHHLWYDGVSGMAAGKGNDVLLKADGGWSVTDSPTFEDILDVQGDGAGVFAVVGARGSIYRYDPARRVWDSVYQTQLSVLLTAGVLADASGAEAWAVGGNKLWHFTGGAWTAQNLPPAPTLTRAGALGLLDGRLIIGGQVDKQGVVLIHDPAFVATDGGVADAGLPDGGAPLPDGWTMQTLRTPQLPRGVFGGGIGSQQGYVVGDYGAVWRWDSNAAAFVEVSRGFYGDVSDVSVVTGDVFAGVNECDDPQCVTRTGVVMHQGDGGAWEPLGVSGFGGPVRSVAARSASEVYAGAGGALWRYDGSAWSRVGVQGGLSGDVSDMRFCGADLWAVSEGGTAYRGGGTILNQNGSVSFGAVNSLFCRSADEVWAAGDGVLSVRTSTMPWTRRDSDTIQHADWRAVWSPGAGEAFAFGDARYGVYWDTVQMSAVESFGGILPDIVTSMWGSSIDNLYAVGLAQFPSVFGFAIRFDGIQWRLVDSGSQRKVTAIDGTGNDDLWVGTEGGGLLKAVPPP